MPAVNGGTNRAGAIEMKPGTGPTLLRPHPLKNSRTSRIRFSHTLDYGNIDPDGKWEEQVGQCWNPQSNAALLANRLHHDSDGEHESMSR